MNARTHLPSGVLTAAGAINFHINKACDSKCRFCFATFRHSRGQLSREDGLKVIEALRNAGGRKLNFAGGEPTIHKHITEYVRFAKSVGFITTLITNGYRLNRLLDQAGDHLDWVGLSCDSADEATQRALGRGHGDHVSQTLAHAARLHQMGIRVKLNSVVTAATWEEDMTAFVRAVSPERWKVFQVLPVAGQNDGSVEPLLISDAQFRHFVDRNAHVADAGIELVAEDNEAMTDSYVMVDPKGRMFGNSDGRDVTSEPLLDIGIEAALAHVGFDVERLIERGGHYQW